MNTHTETISGLHKCQPKNQPHADETKSFAVINMPGKNGKKPWTKIKSESAEKGGVPYRVVSVEPTGWPPDDYGNISFNLEIEKTLGSDGERSSVVPGEAGTKSGSFSRSREDPSPSSTDGVEETRRHLMQSANLLVLCIKATEKAVAPHQPQVAQTSEQFQSDVAKLFIEASSRRTNDGVNWWSYVDKMPDKPIK